MANIFEDDITCKGSITARQGLFGPITRDTLVTDSNEAYPIELQLLRVWDAFGTALGSAAADDMGITAGAFGTGCPYVHAGDMNAAGAVTRRARVLFTLPAEYVDGGTISINIAGGCLTAVCSVSATVDVEAYLNGRNGLISGTDLCTTSAQSINNLTFADKAFTITPTGLVAGDSLDIRFTIAADSATASSHFVALAAIEALLEVKG